MGYRYETPLRRDRADLAARAMGFLWETPGPRSMAGASSAMTSGTQYYTLVGLYAGETITGIAVDVQAGGSSLSLVKFGLVGLDGTLLASTADVKANFTGTGIVASSFSASYSPAVDTAAYVVSICTHTGSGPTLVRFNAAFDPNRYGSNAYTAGRRTGLSDITAAIPNAASGPHYWYAAI